MNRTLLSFSLVAIGLFGLSSLGSISYPTIPFSSDSLVASVAGDLMLHKSQNEVPITLASSTSSAPPYVFCAEGDTASSTYGFMHNLSLGDVHPDVKVLQALLKHGEYGASKGGEADLYDEAMVQAVKKLQVANSITPTGIFGSNTRIVAGMTAFDATPLCAPGEKVFEALPTTTSMPIESNPEIEAVLPTAEIYPTAATSAKRLPVPPRASSFTVALDIGMYGPEITLLQEMLRDIPGVYPEGYVTGVYGEFTARAVGRFQEKYGLANAGDIAHGFVGPATRAKLNSLIK